MTKRKIQPAEKDGWLRPEYFEGQFVLLREAGADGARRIGLVGETDLEVKTRITSPDESYYLHGFHTMPDGWWCWSENEAGHLDAGAKEWDYGAERVGQSFERACELLRVGKWLTDGYRFWAEIEELRFVYEILGDERRWHNSDEIEGRIDMRKSEFVVAELDSD